MAPPPWAGGMSRGCRAGAVPGLGGGVWRGSSGREDVVNPRIFALLCSYFTCSSVFSVFQ